MEKIKAGEPQPEDCKHCESKEGYTLITYMKTYFNQSYAEDGVMGDGKYSDSQTIISNRVHPCCNECNNRLPFKINH